MRTKLLFISVIAAICGLFSISSCSKADYTAPPFDTTLIVGTWDIHHADVTAFGQTTTLSASEIYTMGQAMMGTENVQFLDATLVITETTINGEAYTLVGNRLTRIGEADLSEYKITFENISTTSLTLRYDLNGIVEDMVYMKR